MSKPRRLFSDCSGQILLLEVLIGLVFVIGVTTVVFLNQVGTWHRSANTQRMQARSVAQEGIAYAIQELSASANTWNAALSGVYHGTFNGLPVVTDCNTGNVVSGPAGGRFKLSCGVGAATYPNLQPYEVAVTVVASIPAGNGTDTPTRALRAYLSQRTLGTDL